MGFRAVIATLLTLALGIFLVDVSVLHGMPGDNDISKDLDLRPGAVKGIYYGAHLFGDRSIIADIRELLSVTELNTVVIDKKTDDGVEVTGEKFQKLVAPFKDRGALIMCRLVTLKDNHFAKGKGRSFALKKISRPDELWFDKKGNAYLDPEFAEAANYMIAVSIRAIEDGCSFLNYDYIRLPSSRDGDTANTRYPQTMLTDEVKRIAKTEGERQKLYEENERRDLAKRRAMQKFLARLVSGVRAKYPEVPLAASIFGYACYGKEPNVGQYLDDFVRLGFVVSCMAYPSHYSCNDEAWDPSLVPYKIYWKTHTFARNYLASFGLQAKFIPWVQGYDYHSIERCGLGKDNKGRSIGIPGRATITTGYVSNPPHFRKQLEACNDLGIFDFLVWPSRAAFREKRLYLPK